MVDFPLKLESLQTAVEKPLHASFIKAQLVYTLH